MNRLQGDDDRLTTLLAAVPAPDPPSHFLAGARRRYLEVREARYRRAVFAGFVTAPLGLGLAMMILLSTFELPALIAGVGLAAADLAMWMMAIEIVLSLAPPLVWTAVGLGCVLSLLSIIPLARAGSAVTVK